jgi:hypothetical protein
VQYKQQANPLSSMHKRLAVMKAANLINPSETGINRNKHNTICTMKSSEPPFFQIFWNLPVPYLMSQFLRWQIINILKVPSRTRLDRLVG